MELERISFIERTCRQRGLALTVQRRLILKEFISREDHPTADQIYDGVRHQIPGLSRTTVYRVLDTLVNVGVARKVSHPNAVVRFDPNMEPHHHLICESCGELVDLADGAVEPIAIPDTRTSGFMVSNYSVNFTGLCCRCRNLPS